MLRPVDAGRERTNRGSPGAGAAAEPAGRRRRGVAEEAVGHRREPAPQGGVTGLHEAATGHQRAVGAHPVVGQEVHAPGALTVGGYAPKSR